MKIIVTDIDWDLDNEPIALPNEVTLGYNPNEVEISELDDYICDMLESEHGYCVKNFCFHIEK